MAKVGFATVVVNFISNQKSITNMKKVLAKLGGGVGAVGKFGANMLKHGNQALDLFSKINTSMNKIYNKAKELANLSDAVGDIGESFDMTNKEAVAMMRTMGGLGIGEKGLQQLLNKLSMAEDQEETYIDEKGQTQTRKKLDFGDADLSMIDKLISFQEYAKTLDPEAQLKYYQNILGRQGAAIMADIANVDLKAEYNKNLASSRTASIATAVEKGARVQNEEFNARQEEQFTQIIHAAKPGGAFDYLAQTGTLSEKANTEMMKNSSGLVMKESMLLSQSIEAGMDAFVQGIPQILLALSSGKNALDGIGKAVAEVGVVGKSIIDIAKDMKEQSAVMKSPVIPAGRQ